MDTTPNRAPIDPVLGSDTRSAGGGKLIKTKNKTSSPPYFNPVKNSTTNDSRIKNESKSGPTLPKENGVKSASEWPDWLSTSVKKPPPDTHIPKSNIIPKPEDSPLSPDVKKVSNANKQAKLKEVLSGKRANNRRNLMNIRVKPPGKLLNKDGLAALGNIRVKPPNKLLNKDGLAAHQPLTKSLKTTDGKDMKSLIYKSFNKAGFKISPPDQKLSPSGLSLQRSNRQPMGINLPTRKRRGKKDINFDHPSKKSLNTSGSILKKNSKGKAKSKTFKDWYPDY